MANRLGDEWKNRGLGVNHRAAFPQIESLLPRSIVDEWYGTVYDEQQYVFEDEVVPYLTQIAPEGFIFDWSDEEWAWGFWPKP